MQPGNINNIMVSATMYHANIVDIKPLVRRKRAADVAPLEAVVRAQLTIVEVEGTFCCDQFLYLCTHF